VSLRAAVWAMEDWFPPPLVPSPGKAMLVKGLTRGVDWRPKRKKILLVSLRFEVL
jgi:hypothetical protein